MKKSLSLLMAVLLAFSAFTFSAFAQDDLTVEEKYNKLVEEGIFSGFPDGEAHLDWNMNRAQAAKIVALVFELGENPAAAGIYTDIVGSDEEWALGFIGAATAAGILEGRGDGIFDPGSDVTIQELAIIMVRALGIEVDEDATVEGASDWAGKYVKAALDAGLIPPQSDYTVPASRELLVVASYAAYEQVNGGAVEAVTATAAATGAKKITVTFNQPVDDTKAQISVKYNNNTVNPSKITFSEDKTSAVIEFANNLLTGDYTVTVAGLSDEPLVLTVKVEAQKVSKIEFTTPHAIKDRNAQDIVTVGYRVLNQYDEEITGNVTLTVTASKGKPIVDSSKKKITLDTDDSKNGSGGSNDYGPAFNVGESVTVALLYSENGAFVSQQFNVVAPAHVATVGAMELYNADGKVMEANLSSGFYILLDLQDQYGNAITEETIAEEDLIVTVSNNSIFDVKKATGDQPDVSTQNKKLAIELVPPQGKTTYQAGSSTVSVLSRHTGSRATIDVTVKDVAKIDTLTLSAPDLAPIGESVVIPYTAYDQFGNEVKNLDALKTKLSATGGATIDFDTDPITKVTTLKLNLSGVSQKGTIVITGTTETNKFVSLTVTTVDAAVPVRVDGLKGNTTLLLSDSREIKASDVIVKDQYGRDFNSDNLPSDYKIKVAKSGDAISVVDSTDQATEQVPAIVKAAKKGTATLTLSLVKGTDDVANSSSPSITIRVVDNSDISSYEATVSGTVYDYNDLKYGKELKVEGILADGTRVTVPHGGGSNYTVLIPTASTGLDFDPASGKIYSKGGILKENEDGQRIIIVTVLLNNEVEQVTVNLSSKLPEITTLSLGDVPTALQGTVKKLGDNAIAVEIGELTSKTAFVDNVIKQLVKAKDQYGVDIDPGIVEGNVFITGTKSDLSEVEDGKTFTAIVFTPNGKSISITVSVYEDN